MWKLSFPAGVALFKPTLGFPSGQIRTFRISRAHKCTGTDGVLGTGQGPATLVARWLPGSRPACRRSVPLGASRTLRLLETFVKSTQTLLIPVRGGRQTPGVATSRTRGRAGRAVAATRRGGPRCGRPGRATRGSTGRPPSAAVPAGKEAAWTCPESAAYVPNGIFPAGRGGPEPRTSGAMDGCFVRHRMPRMDRRPRSPCCT